MNELILYSSFEDISKEFAKDKLNSKLMEFIEPLPEIEAEINEIISSLKNSGKVLFVLGKPGAGKSTFIQSLEWRPHIKLRKMVQINANDYTSEGSLIRLFAEIQKYENEAREKRDKGVTCLVINYLEYLDEFEDEEVKGFFRRLNGILRNSPIFIIWPATDESDVLRMQEHAKNVSGTLFYRGKEIVRFYGPKIEKFADIALRTISVLNNGKELSDFGLTYGDLLEVCQELEDKMTRDERTMREYLEMLKERWRKANNYQNHIQRKIPKSTEVWFIFSYKEAESVVAQFVRKAKRNEDNSCVIHDKLYEYIHEGNQRGAIWNPKRLQLALYGALKTRILFLPTNTLISCVAAYSQNPELREIFESVNIPSTWKQKSAAKRFLKNSPIYKQIIGEAFAVGMRKGPATEAIQKAQPAFLEMVKWVTGAGSDREINRALAQALTACESINAVSEIKHPWIPNIIPDIFIDLPHKQVCLEFHYTSKDEPGVIASYVLKKLNAYMNQLENLINEPMN